MVDLVVWTLVLTSVPVFMPWRASSSKFNLTLPEAISGLRAFIYMGFSPFFFVNACHLILGMGEKHPPETGFRFGLFILQL